MGIQAKFQTPSCTLFKANYWKVFTWNTSLSLLRNTASSSLRANRSISIQLHCPRLESTAFL